MIPIIPLDHPRGASTASGLSASPPLSLYIHIPWCVRKCPYCDFNSHENKADIPEQAYVQALIQDLEQSVPLVWGRKLRSIFFGGGTPSLFSPESIDQILAHVRMLLPLEYEAEITLEANPGTVDSSHFSGYRQAGINRLSLGIQSFASDKLVSLGRIHNSEQAIQAAKLAINTFDNVNLDVMYALPQQTIQQALADAEQACQLHPKHLSFYHLTLEPNTAFYHNPPSLPDDDTSATMQELIEQRLQAHGYQHYETSAFAKPGHQARHNLNYWTFGDYLGVGAGAHSKLSFHDRIMRQSRFKHPKQYMQTAPAGKAVEAEWNIEDLGFEFMMNALRLTQGFDAQLFQQRTGKPLSTVTAKLQQAQKQGLLLLQHKPETGLWIQPSLRGQRFLNELLQLFLD
jgi:putative oxygen-independent coproporphyrinogen III oxidase